MPLVKPNTTIPDVAPVATICPGSDTTSYSMTASPPLLLGAIKFTVALLAPLVAITPVGASGIVAGVTVEDALE